MSKLKHFLKKAYYVYEVDMAPFIASYLYFLYWPLYLICKISRAVFITNVSSGTGHITAELDYFFRKRYLEKTRSKARYIWVRKSDEFSKAMTNAYRDQFYYACCSYLAYALILPLILRYRKITLDCGISRLKWEIRKDRTIVRPNFPQSYIQQVSKKRGIEQLRNYFEICAKTSHFFPLKDGVFQSSFKDLNIPKKKTALIHIKYEIRNATAMKTDPSTLVTSLTYLKDMGYHLIFVGREKMPDEFKSLSIQNYSESIDACFANDLYLFRNAEIAITSGSGISYLADRMDKPYLYLNSWHLSVSTISEKCIEVPCLAREKSTGKFLSFSEQIQLYETLPDRGKEEFPHDKYLARNATSDEILHALEELMSLPQKLKTLQNQYCSLAPDSPLFWGKSRCSNYFLEKHKHLLN